MIRATARIVPLWVALTIAAPALGQSEQETSARLDALFGAHEPYQAFLAELKDAVAADDREAVAGMIAYPLAARIGGAPVTLATTEAFLRRYGELVTPAVAAAIADQTYAALFARADGVMIGDGEVWFSGVCEDAACAEVSVGIIAINPPDGPGGAAGSDR